jgi:hypothetical protein
MRPSAWSGHSRAGRLSVYVNHIGSHPKRPSIAQSQRASLVKTNTSAFELEESTSRNAVTPGLFHDEIDLWTLAHEHTYCLREKTPYVSEQLEGCDRRRCVRRRSNVVTEHDIQRFNHNHWNVYFSIEGVDTFTLSVSTLSVI